MRASALLALFALTACDARESSTPAETPTLIDTDPPSARRDIRAAFEAARNAPKHASDGGGRAWLELAPGDDGSVLAGRTRSWTIVYEAGELGVALGGTVFLQVSPFFEWSSPQTSSEEALGFTRVRTEAAGVELEARAIDQQLLGATVRGRALEAGERVVFEYGAGPAGAKADPYAERDSRFWIAVDGDGDGVRKVLADSPGVDVRPGPAALLVATLTSTVRVGEALRLKVALLDARANRIEGGAGTIVFVDAPDGVTLPAQVELEADARGVATLTGAASAEGVFQVRLRAEVEGRKLEALSNPLLVSNGPKVHWADLHGHTSVSDGSGAPQDYFDYARDVAALDIAALTDHDHWGMLPLDEHPELWERNVAVARAYDRPGSFVALPGYEYTDWIGGHRHVLFFGERAPLYSALDPRYDTPAKLREALRPESALIVPHHPAGGPIALDWSAGLDAELEPVVEICSAHGASDALDGPRVIHSPRPGHFVRDALERGVRMGLIGSGDGHDGHPGLTAKGPHYPTGGLAAIVSDDLSREGVLAALRARRCYATSGPRILLRFALGSTRMGGVIRAADAVDAPLFVQAIGAAGLKTVEIVARGERVTTIDAGGELEFAASAAFQELANGDWIYVRVVQVDGGMAWSSPIFVE
ncbi:MAG: CehA/McbA family metallohydrolase [Planctomycetes bacterium]|nr:CehA/McbA family metallohydrolase [Planctomycetota bacterium]